MIRNILLVGAGNIGSRHLQSLARIKEPLFIQVVDPSKNSLAIAKQRYDEVAKNSKHQVNYLEDLNKISSQIDIAIIATNSNIRFAVGKQLLETTSVKYIIFEKILFDKFVHYSQMEQLLKKNKVKAWVNCSRRTMPFYANLKKEVQGQKIQYLISGNDWGLASNAIHYLDHLSLLTDCDDFRIDISQLNPVLAQSKRQGFLELNGTLLIYSKNCSIGSLTSYPGGNAPQVMEIISPEYRILTTETLGESSISSVKSNWKWELKKTPFLYQSEMTNLVVEDLLKSGNCNLTPYTISQKLHLNLFKPLYKFVNDHSKKKYDKLPFT